MSHLRLLDRVWMGCLCLVGVICSNAWAANPLKGTLQLASGDVLTGSLTGANSGGLFWHSELFDGTFEIDQNQVHTVKFPPSSPLEQATSNERFRVSTVRGDVLFGDVIAMSPAHLTLDTVRGGRVSLKRASIREIRQVKHSEILYDGPNHLDDWRVLKVGRRKTDWKENEYGHLSTTTYGGELYRDLPRVDNAEIQLLLRWEGTPAFQIDFASAAEIVARKPSRLSIKSWTDEVVAQTSVDVTEFSHLFDIDPNVKEMRLRILWNTESGNIVIHDGVGNQLSKTIADTQPRSHFGVFIRNRGDDLSVELLRVSRWNGMGPTGAEEGGSNYVRLADNTLVRGEIVSLDTTSQEMLVREFQPEKQRSGTSAPELARYPLSDIALVETFRRDRDFENELNLLFNDGNELRGSIQELDGDTLTLGCASTEEPIALDVQGLREIRFSGRRQSVAESPYRLTLANGRRFRGRFSSTGANGSLGWMPTGSKNSVELTTASEFTLDRVSFDRDVASKGTMPQEILFLKDGTELAGVVDAIDAESVTVRTRYARKSKIPIERMQAIEMFDASGRVSFVAPTWESLRQTRPLQQSHKRLEISEQISIRDLTVKHDGRIMLNASWDAKFVGLMTLHLGDQQERNTSIARFTFSRDRVIARCLQQAQARTLPPFSERRVSISLLGDEDKLRVYVNSVLAFEQTLKKPLKPRGLWIQAGSAKGPLSSAPQNGAPIPRLVLEGLRVGSSVGTQGIDIMDQQNKNVMLQVPRNRKDRAPSHVLFAKNGDVIRGFLEGMDTDRVQFRSRFTRVSFARSQVAGIVWLTPREGDGPAADKSPSVDHRFAIAMRDGSSVTFPTVSVHEDKILGEHEVFGDFSIPVDSILRIHTGQSSRGLLSESFANWQLFDAPEPRFATTNVESGIESPLVGKLVDDVVIPMLDGSQFAMSGQRGKVVVLDFWATWCAPCIRSLPGLSKMMLEFPRDKVTWVAVNQAEAESSLPPFLEARGWEIPVGLDTTEAISRRFLVEAIPNTIIIAPDGKVARVFVGAPTGLHEGIAKAIAELLP